MRFDKQILVIEDDDPIRALLVTVFHRRGFLVESARDGVEALEKLGSGQYALLVLDLMMPRMNGYELLAELRTMGSSPPLVLILTAGTEPRTFDPSLVVGTVQKPFDIELLVDTVEGCLGATESLRGPSPTLTPPGPALHQPEEPS